MRPHPLLFDLHSRVLPEVLPEVADFLFGTAKAHNFTRLLFFCNTDNPFATSVCNSVVERAHSLDRLSSVTTINQTAPWLWKDHITRHRPEILIACTDTSNEVEFVMNEVRFLTPLLTAVLVWYGLRVTSHPEVLGRKGWRADLGV